MKAPMRRLSITLLLIFSTFGGAPVWADLPQSQPERWGRYVEACVNTLIERGADRYGEVHSPMLMTVLDVRTLDSPQDPPVLDSLVRLEGRIHRRGERGSNLWHDQPVLSAMYELSERTNNSKYAQAADDYVRYALEHCRKENGLLVWGTHIYWDCYNERAAGDDDGRGPHEILVHRAAWPAMYRVAPEGVKQEIDLIWEHHVHNKETGRHNRHDYGHPGADFPFSAGTYIQAFAFMESVAPDEEAAEYLRRAKLVTDWHWNQRNPETNLVAFEPGNLLYNREDWDFYGETFASAVTGPHAAQLLRSYELTGDVHFRDVAVAYLLAYDKYGWDEAKQTFVGMLNLDGQVTSVADVPAGMRSQLAGGANEPDPNYSVPPIGPVDIWPTTIYPLDFPLLTAQSTILAYEQTPADDSATRAGLLQAARHWATAIEAALPPQPGRTFQHTFFAALPEARETGGTYAANYGRAISFFTHLYRATQEQRYLDVAHQLAQDAVDKLYVETELTDAQGAPRRYGIFKGHPAKPYYETVDGVGFLLLALLELDRPNTPSPGAF